jgi:tetratricopeptide (TPR) repeat protein
MCAAVAALVCSFRESLQASLEPARTQVDLGTIEVLNSGKPVPYQPTPFTDLGPQVGNILNAHYFPAVNYYKHGNYVNANDQLSYVLMRPSYLDGNPNQAQYLSTAYYMRGMIFLHHANGIGRLTLAREDFAAAISWNPRNYPAYLELSVLFSTVGLKDQAAAILRSLIDLNPDPDVRAAAEAEMQKSDSAAHDLSERKELKEDEFVKTRSTSSAFAVQVGAFQDEHRADELRKQLEKQYPTVTVQPSADKTVYLVRIGEPDMETAKKIAAELRTHDLKPVVVRLNGDD